METKLNESNLKLIEYSTQYSKFNKNQVLTETQLNGFLDYFDDQDRLTRTSLSGVGIVCGFKVSLTEEGITITQGRGVTTDGDLLALLNPILTKEEEKDPTLKSLRLQSKTYTHYKAFFDTKALYKKFLNPEEEQIKLYELKEADGDAHEELSNFNDLESSILSNMLVLLYLESYAKEADLCNQLTCDNQGIEQVARLRVLLVSKADAEYIANKDNIFSKHNWYETYANLPVVSSPRIVVNPRVTRSYARLKAEYFQSVVGSGVLSGLHKGLNTILAKFEQSEISNPVLERIFAFRRTNVPNDFQYRFDALNDLINTYNQIKELLLDMNVECCPAIGAFPKHLMLGKVVELQEYPTLRHQFYKSPIIPSDNLNYQKVMSLLNRVRELLQEFNTGDKTGEVRITPSLDISVLSNKAIPFYYKLTNPLMKYWNFLKSSRFMEKHNLSYHRERLANVPSVRNPLDYNLDGFDFYRIEGHQGKPYKDALREINKLKVQKGLNFDVKALSIETNSSDFDMQKYKCHFEDLNVLFNVWKAEQECILEQIFIFFSGFSTTVPGKNWISEREGYDRLERAFKEKEAALLKEKEKAERAKEQAEKEKLIQELFNAIEKRYELSEKGDREDVVDKDDQVVVDIKDDIVNKGDDVVKDDLMDKIKDYKEIDKVYEYDKDKIVDDQMHHVDKVYDWTGERIKEDDIAYKDGKYNIVESAEKIKEEGDYADMISKKYEEKYIAKEMSPEEMKAYELYKTKTYIPESNESVKMWHSAKMVSAVSDDAIAEEKKRAYYENLEVTKSDASKMNMYELADLAKKPSPSQEEKELADYQKKRLTRDQLAKQEKELIEKFEEKIAQLEKEGVSKKTIEKYKDQFRTYLEDLRNGKAVYVSDKDKREVISRGKGSIGVIATKEPIFKEAVVDKINTIGRVFLEIIKENPGASPATIIRAVQAEMTQISQTSAWKKEPELTEFILKEVARTLAITYLLDYNLPRDIERLSESALNTYQNILRTLCEQIKDLQASFRVAQLEAGTAQITEMLMTQLASVCCSGKQLKVIYDEMQSRIDSILLKTRLFEFVKNHPGLEHKAGVRDGGTFVMVYLEGDETPVEKTQTSLELKFLEIPEVESVSEEEMILQLWDEDLRFSFRFINQKFAEEAKEELLKEEKAIYSLVPIQEEMTKTISYFADLLNKNFAIRGILNTISAVAKGNLLRFTIQNENVKEGTGYFQTNDEAILGTSEPFSFKIERSFDDFLQAKDRVVADFSLPYMCCSDCAPVNFVIPKDPPILRLPQEYICLKDGEPVTPIPFSVSPEDGEIEAEVYGGIESGLIFDDEGKAFFDASLTDPSLHGKEIGFKVDGEATNCTIVVYPEPPLSVTSAVEYNELRTEAKVIFTVSHIYPNLEHTWKDGIEGHVSNVLPDAAGNVSFVYDNLPVNETNTITPTLSISNGFCDKLVEIEPITFEDPITEVKLEIQNTYCIDNADGDLAKIPFTVVDPEGLTIRFAKEKVVGLEISENNLIINPSQFEKFYKPIEFTLGGLPTEANITVYPSLVVAISPVSGDLIFKDETYYQEFTFSANFDGTINTEGITMIWEIEGVEAGEGKEWTHNFLIKEEVTTYKVTLKAAQEGGCTTEVSTVISVENPDFKLTMPDNRTKYCLSDETAYPITLFPESEGVVVEGLGVSYDEEKDVYLFTPSKTGLSAASIVPLSIDGNTYLKLRVDTIAVARFEVRIEDRHVVVVNKSDDAAKYILEIGGYSETFTTKDTYRISVDKFDQEIIDVTLTTVTFCGKDVAKQTGISLKTSLELPVKSVCLKEGEEVKPLAFTVIPENGKVEALVDASFKSGLYYDENRKPFFDASMTDPALYGKLIEFTLDGRKTDCAITVYPELPLTVDSSVSYNDTKTEAEVTFKVSQVYSGVEYLWSDSLGNEESITPAADGKIAFRYNLPVNDSNTLAFGLTLIQGPCPTKIPIEPITFEDPILDFSLNIQNTFCIGDADGEFAKIPFTNINPEGLPIGIVGEPGRGLKIEGEELVIEVKDFERFNEKIEFTLGGNPTGAHITIYPVFEIGIYSEQDKLKWVNNQLVATYSFNTILPGGMNVSGLTSQWEVGGQIVSTETKLEYDFPVLQSPMGYEVRLRVIQNGACPIEASSIINIEYPEFSMNIPNNQLEYCFNDSKPYDISINPQVEGFVIEGSGMSRIDAENRNVFTPNQSGLPNGGSVPLSFDGLTYLTLNVSSTPQARFTVEVINNEIQVTNTSDTADEYIFNVAGEIITYQRKVSFKRSVDLYETDTIDISLTTKSPCGDGYLEQKGIKIKDDQTEDLVDTGNCAADTLKRIENDNNNLPSVADLDVPSDVRTLVIDETQFQYQNAMMPGMLDGGTFDLLKMGTLFNDTGANIGKFRDDDKMRITLSQYLVAQAKLFFNILHCQPHSMLRMQEQNIIEFLNEINRVLNELRTKRIRYDEQKELQTFLMNYMNSSFVVDFIRDFIKSPLLPEVQASNNV
jgi:hypothetical protein